MEQASGQAAAEMPLYQCHRQVWALKIKQVVKHAHPDSNADDAAFEASDAFHGAHLVPENGSFAPIPVDADWYRKHQPEAGGYYVVYEDGYKSYSPVQAFESGYTPVPVESKGSIEQDPRQGPTAPRVTPADIEAEIVGEYYASGSGAFSNNSMPASHIHTLHLLTFCVLVTRNGFTVTGQSACASPENFDAELGRKIARQDATAKLWPLLGFRLRDRLAAPPVMIGTDLTPEELAEVTRSGRIASVTLKAD